MSALPRHVLFVCTHNSARSVLAEGLLGRLGSGRWIGHSAGSHPSGRVNPFALDVLRSRGCSLDDVRSKHWESFSGPDAPAMDYVVTVCDNAAGEVCPVWPGNPMQLHWGFADPSAIGDDDQARRAAFEDTAGQIAARIQSFLAEVEASSASA
ncbi:MAG: arsenate reductase ArsC [Pseudomonadota bacterium]|nr:arsenate reductase ArsC [Pseudomonadota bacterium]